MKIVVVDFAASSGGALTILNGFYDFICSDNDAKNHEWIFLLSNKYLTETKNVKVIILDKQKRWIRRLLFDFLTGRRILRKISPDIIFSMQNTFVYGMKCPQVIYMHQSIPFQKDKRFSLFKSDERLLFVYQYIIGWIIKKSIKRADLTVVQSEWIKEALLETTGLRNDKVLKIMPPIKNLSSFKFNTLFKNNSFFYPASYNLYKNHECIFKAIDILNTNGIVNLEVILTIENKMQLNNSIIKFRGEMEHIDVINQFNISTLLYPSYIETFGLPLLEARQMGCIILSADTAFAREVLDGYNNAYFFNPFHPNELAELMKRVITGIYIKKEEFGTKTFDSKSSWKMVFEHIINIEK